MRTMTVSMWSAGLKTFISPAGSIHAGSSTEKTAGTKTAAYCRNWIADTLQGAERGAFVRLISIRVFEALGLDTTPLVQAREAYKRRQEQKRREQEEKEAEERRAREEQHQPAAR